MVVSLGISGLIAVVEYYDILPEYVGLAAMTVIVLALAIYDLRIRADNF